MPLFLSEYNIINNNLHRSLKFTVYTVLAVLYWTVRTQLSEKTPLIVKEPNRGRSILIPSVRIILAS